MQYNILELQTAFHWHSLTQPERFQTAVLVFAYAQLCRQSRPCSVACLFLLMTSLTTFLLWLAMNSAKSVIPSCLCWLEKAKSSVRFRKRILKITSDSKDSQSLFRVSSTLLRLPTSPICSKFSVLTCFVSFLTLFDSPITNCHKRI